MTDTANKNSIGNRIGIAGALFALASLIAYFVYIHASGVCNPLVIVGLLAALAAEALEMKTNADILSIVAPVGTAIALCAFLMDSIETFVGFFMNLAMFGDASLIGYIFTECILTLLATVVLLVSAFLKK